MLFQEFEDRLLRVQVLLARESCAHVLAVGDLDQLVGDADSIHGFVQAHCVLVRDRLIPVSVNGDDRRRPVAHICERREPTGQLGAVGQTSQPPHGEVLPVGPFQQVCNIGGSAIVHDRGNFQRRGFAARRAFSSVNERLQAARRIAGFSIHAESGELLPMVHKAEFDPTDKNRVLVFLTRKPHERVTLRYCFGKDVYCNVRDSADMSLPAFGPIPIQ